ncbi:hypothetical protein PCE1_003671 [Barthelona sp. PCE]
MSLEGNLDSEKVYFQSYEHHSIHYDMLNDYYRTIAYEHAITHNCDIFRDKVVLDVGAGTGILSLFAAKAGAKHVFAVEPTSMYKNTEAIVALNNYSDRITVIKAKVEDVTLEMVGGDRVDIIISEWMGYCLLFENMLESVLIARDNLLKDDGILLPDRIQLHAHFANYIDYNHMVNFWDNVHGFDFSIFKGSSIYETILDEVHKDDIASDYGTIFDLSLYDVKSLEDIYRRVFKTTIDLKENTMVNGLCMWFKCIFTQRHKGGEIVELCTSPYSPHTHWKQTMVLFDDHYHMRDLMELSFYFDQPENNHRELTMDIKISSVDDEEDRLEMKRLVC